MDPFYLAVSLPDDFAWPEDSPRGRLIEQVVLPACRDHRLPFAMMIGVRRAVNPALRDAGDGVGKADVSTVHRLCRTHPDNRFLVTMLSRENQHELCVAARKFANLMPFGCWWFLNNPSIVFGDHARAPRTARDRPSSRSIRTRACSSSCCTNGRTRGATSPMRSPTSTPASSRTAGRLRSRRSRATCGGCFLKIS